MHHYCIYVFDSSTANEAAVAVKEGSVESIIEYHSNKHQNKQHPPPPMPGNQPQIHPQTMLPQPGQQQPMMSGPPPPGYRPSHHVSPPNHMHPGLPSNNQQPYDQKMIDREVSLNRLSQLATLTTPAPNMPLTNQSRSMQPQHQIPPQTQPPHNPQQSQQQPQPSLPPQQQSQRQPPPQQSQQLAMKSEPLQQQPLDPLSSMQAMTEHVHIDHPNMDNNNFTIHHT